MSAAAVSSKDSTPSGVWMPSAGMKMFWGVVHIWPEYRLRENARFPVIAFTSSQPSRMIELTPAFSV